MYPFWLNITTRITLNIPIRIIESGFKKYSNLYPFCSKYNKGLLIYDLVGVGGPNL